MIVHGGEVTRGSTSSVSIDRNKETHLLYLKLIPALGKHHSPHRSEMARTYFGILIIILLVGMNRKIPVFIQTL